MTKMKDKIYPDLPNTPSTPSAPAIELREMNNNTDRHTYRLKVIADIQKFLETEISKRDAFSKKYFHIAKVVSNIDSVLIGITICAEGAGAVLLATGVGSPIALGLGISGAAAGAISLLGNIAVNKTTVKAEKH